MEDRRKTAGNYGENAAVGYLASKGYKMVAQNFRHAGGEIDIVARDGGVLVFVEVKYRKQLNFGRPAEDVGVAKRKAIITAAYAYLYENDLHDISCRFDVIEVFGRELLEINHIENAFEEC